MAGEKKGLFRDIWNLPNMLTLMRIFAIPVVLAFIYLSDPGKTTGGIYRAQDIEESKLYCWIAFLLFSLAAITDYFDGYLARTMKLETLTGKFLDPLADKLIVMATLVGLVELLRVPSWIVILILLREFAINGLRTLAIAEGLSMNVIQAGKWKTTFQLTGIACLIINYTYAIPFLPSLPPVNFNLLGVIFLLISLAFSIGSAITYFMGLMEASAAARKNKASEESFED